MISARYLIRRLALAVVVLGGILVVTFVISRMIPTSPERLYAGPRATNETLIAVREQLGLDRPLHVQFVSYVAGLLQGDLGESILTKRPILRDIMTFLPATLELVIVAMLIASVLGIGAGVIAGAYRGGAFDRVSRTFSIASVSFPVFWLALLMQLLFFGALGWLPIGGRLDLSIELATPIERVTGFYLIDAALAGNWVAWRNSLSHLIMPVIAVAILPFALSFRITRASMIEAVNEDYITAARAAGIPERRVLFRLALKNASIPTLTVVGMIFAYSITGAFLVEIIFSWPGIGKYMADAILRGDFPVVLAVTLIVTVIYIGANLVVDLTQASLDPRIRLE